MNLHRDIPLSVQVTVPQKDASEKRVAKLATEFGNYSSPLEKPAITVLFPLAEYLRGCANDGTGTPGRSCKILL